MVSQILGYPENNLPELNALAYYCLTVSDEEKKFWHQRQKPFFLTHSWLGKRSYSVFLGQDFIQSLMFMSRAIVYPQIG